MNIWRMLIITTLAVALCGTAAAQDPAKLVTKSEVEKVTGLTFKDGRTPMKGSLVFEQLDGDLQIGVDIEAREAGATVRGWEATMKKMQPATKVETVPGLGSDAIYFSTRADMGKVSADFEKPRVQLNVSVALAKSPAQARQIAIDLAKIAGSRIGK